MENGVSFSDGTNRFLTEEDVEVSSTILRAYNNQEVKLSLESRAISSIPKELYECHELKVFLVLISSACSGFLCTAMPYTKFPRSFVVP